MFTLWIKNVVRTRLNTQVIGMPLYHEIYRMPGFRFVAGVCREQNAIYKDGGRYLPR